MILKNHFFHGQINQKFQMQVFFFLLAAVSIALNFWFMMQLSNREEKIKMLSNQVQTWSVMFRICKKILEHILR